MIVRATVATNKQMDIEVKRWIGFHPVACHFSGHRLITHRKHLLSAMEQRRI